MEDKVRVAIKEERIEDDLKDVRMEKVFSPMSTKQAMIARVSIAPPSLLTQLTLFKPPPVLALHINRSVHYGHYASKNNVRLLFPEVLDLTPYTTSGNLSTVPTSAISTPPPALPRSTTPTPATYANPRIIYRLSAVVCHYGQHSFGHYICYRRKPKHPSVGADKRWAPPKIIDPLQLEDDPSASAEAVGMEALGPRYVFEDETDIRPGKGWLRISDDAVRECGIETVLQEGTGAFMLYYERAVQELPGVYLSGNGSPRSSEETLKPELKTVNLNGSVASLVSEVGVGIRPPHPHSHPHPNAYARTQPLKDPLSSANYTTESRNGKPTPPIPLGLSSSLSLSQSQTLNVPGARIVRNVTTTRRRSTSVTDRSQSRSSVESTTPTREMNGHLQEVKNNGLHHDLSASAPTLIQQHSSPTKNPSHMKTKGKNRDATSPTRNTASASSSSQRDKGSLPRIHSPQPHHPPNGTPVVDLKA